MKIRKLKTKGYYFAPFVAAIITYALGEITMSNLDAVMKTTSIVFIIISSFVYTIPFFGKDDVYISWPSYIRLQDSGTELTLICHFIFIKREIIYVRSYKNKEERTEILESFVKDGYKRSF